MEVGGGKIDEKHSDQTRIENRKCQPGLCQKPRATKQLSATRVNQLWNLLFLDTNGSFSAEEQFGPVADHQRQGRNDKCVVNRKEGLFIGFQRITRIT